MKLPAFVGLLCGVAASAFAQQPQAPLRRARLHILCDSGLFISASRGDAVAALRVWGDQIGRKRGFQLDTTVDLVDDPAEFRKRVLAGWAGVIAVDAIHHLKLADLPAVKPDFSAAREPGAALPRYILLVRAEAGISSLEALRGKTVIVHASTGANLGAVWLDAMLHDGRLGSRERFFHSVETVTKASAAILPVFFGKADAAVVEQTSFDVTREMNPQVGAKLRVLDASPALTEALICISEKQEYRDEVLAAMRDLHLDIQGKQILMVFRFSRLMPLDLPAFERVRELWRKHLALARAPAPLSSAAGRHEATGEITQ